MTLSEQIIKAIQEEKIDIDRLKYGEIKIVIHDSKVTMFDTTRKKKMS